MCAGEMLRLAGFSSGTGRCARGGCSAGRGWENPSGFAALNHLPFQGRLLVRLMLQSASPERGGVAAGDGGVILLARRVLRSHFAYHTFLLECFMFVPRLLFVARAKQRRLAASCVSVPRRSRSPVERSQMLYGYRTCLVHFRLVRFFPAIPTGERSRRRGVGPLLRNHISLAMLSAGSTLGLRAPDCAKEPLTLWTLFIRFAAKYLFAKPRNNCYPRIAALTLCNTRVHGKTCPTPIYGRAGRAV